MGMTTLREAIGFLENRLRTECKYCDLAYLCANTNVKCTFLESLEIALECMVVRTLDNAIAKDKQKEGEEKMRSKAGVKFDCIFEETLDFIDIEYTHLNMIVRYEKRPHGKIIIDEDGNTSCSECGQTSVFGNFCCNCGADVRKGEAE